MTVHFRKPLSTHHHTCTSVYLEVILCLVIRIQKLGPVPISVSHVSEWNVSQAEVAEVARECTLSAAAVGSLLRQGCGTAIVHCQPDRAAWGLAEVPGWEAGGVEPPSPGCALVARQDNALNGGGTALCG